MLSRSHDERVAAATRRDRGNRRRYRGRQRRGTPSRSDRDRDDLHGAIEAIAKALPLFEAFYAAEAAHERPLELGNARDAALAALDLGVRFVTSIYQRHGYEHTPTLRERHRSKR